MNIANATAKPMIDGTPLPKRSSVMGIPMTALTTDELLDTTLHAIPAGNTEKPFLLGYMNLHGIYLYHRDERLKAYYDEADIVYLDGMPVVWAARLAGYPLSREHRTTAIDWIVPLVGRLHEAGYGAFFLGGEQSANDKALAHFREQVPGAHLVGRNGFYDAKPNSADSLAIVEQINNSGCQALFLCMGMPRQEAWYLAHRHLLKIKMVWCLGATLDYFGGTVKTPPRWMGQFGLEWLFRLLSEPKRLWYRYLVEPWALLPLVLRDIARRGANRRAQREGSR